MSEAMPETAYASAGGYAHARPQYDFDGTHADVLLSDHLARIDPLPTTLVDCGAGPGLVWPDLPEAIDRIIAVEPARELWHPEPPDRVEYIHDSALRYLAMHHEPDAAVAWLWSVSYAILAHFEVYDALFRRFIRVDAEVAGAAVSRALHDAVSRWAHAPQVFAVVDEATVEQVFVTDLWTSYVAPFPFGDRGYPRILLRDCLATVAAANDGRVDERHLDGVADYGPTGEAASRMLSFQFHGSLAGVADATREVASFVERFDGRIPAGCYLYTYLPPGFALAS